MRNDKSGQSIFMTVYLPFAKCSHYSENRLFKHIDLTLKIYLFSECKHRHLFGRPSIYVKQAFKQVFCTSLNDNTYETKY